MLNDFPEHLKEALVMIIKKEGYETCSITKRTLSSKGANLLGILHEVDVIGTAANGCNKTNYLFIKQAMVLNKIRAVSIDNIYSKEVYFYTEVAQILDNLQNEADIPERERFNIANGYDESSEKAIILENLTRKGYKTFNKAEGLTLKCAELSIEQLAKFHALCLVMQKRMPDYYEMKIKKQKCPVMFNDDWNGFLVNICGKFVDALEEDTKSKVGWLLSRMQNDYPSYLTEDSPVCVMCHGDYKPQNIMIKEVDGEVVDVMPLDYQLAYHGCPINDLMFYIFSGTDQQFRGRHLEHLKGLYHDCMGRFLGRFGVDVEAVFPRGQFERMYKERLLFGLMVGTLMSYFAFVPEDDLPDVENSEMSEFVVNPEPGYESWVRGLVDDFTQWGCL
ncbi:unnamed protein product, partial [Iphiclides podalirius]